MNIVSVPLKTANFFKKVAGLAGAGYAPIGRKGEVVVWQKSKTRLRFPFITRVDRLILPSGTNVIYKSDLFYRTKTVIKHDGTVFKSALSDSSVVEGGSDWVYCIKSKLFGPHISTVVNNSDNIYANMGERFKINARTRKAVDKILDNLPINH